MYVIKSFTTCGRTVTQNDTTDNDNNVSTQHPKQLYKSYPSNASRQPRSGQKHNQDTLLPLKPWTDYSDSDAWLDLPFDNDPPFKNGRSNDDADFYYQPSNPFPPDIISNMCQNTPVSPSVISTSDVTVSPSSSESYPECRF